MSKNEEVMVSVYCITYNHEKFIKQCLDGFIMQKTNFKFEVIVHDDASTDNTANIIREYEKKYPDIIKPIYQTENQYSKGVKIIKEFIWPRMSGKYVACCEGDDFWCDENKLQLQFDAMEKNRKCSMCVHKTKVIDANDASTGRIYPPYGVHITRGINSSKTFLPEVIFPNSSENHFLLFHISSTFLRKSLLDEYYGNMPNYVKICPVGDVSILLFFSYSGDVYYIDSIMSYYRSCSGPDSWSVKKNTVECQNHYKKMIEVFKEYDRFSNGDFHEECVKRITLNRTLILASYENKMKESLKTIEKDSMMKEMYNDVFSTKTRFKNFALAYFPSSKRLYKLYKEIRDK